MTSKSSSICAHDRPRGCRVVAEDPASSAKGRAGTKKAKNCSGSTSSDDRCTAEPSVPTAASSALRPSPSAPRGAVAPATGGGYVLAAGQGFLFLDDSGEMREAFAQPERGRTGVRMNDGACDPQGRFWAGTMAYDESPGAGTLYRLELDGNYGVPRRYDPPSQTASDGAQTAPRCTSTTAAPHPSTHSASTARPAPDVGDRRHRARAHRPAERRAGRTHRRRARRHLGRALGRRRGERVQPDGVLQASVRTSGRSARPRAHLGGPNRDILFVRRSTRVDLDETDLARQPEAGRVFAIDGLGIRGLPCLLTRGLLTPS